VIKLLCALSLMLAACSFSSTPNYGPGTPRNGADLPVDSRYGTPLPGVYKGN